MVFWRKTFSTKIRIHIRIRLNSSTTNNSTQNYSFVAAQSNCFKYWDVSQTIQLNISHLFESFKWAMYKVMSTTNSSLKI